MHVNIIRTIAVNAKVVDIGERTGLRIQNIDYDGACVESQNFNQKLVTSSWKPKNDPKSVTAQDFMDIVVDKFPFAENFDESLFANDFFALKHQAPRCYYYYKPKFEQYVKDFASRYSIRKDIAQLLIPEDQKNEAQRLSKETDIETYIIVKDKDHIVFWISKIFEKTRKPDIMELWNFQIEAIYNVDNDEKWKITKMFINRPLDQFNVGFTEFFADLTEDFAESVRRDIESIGRSHVRNKDIEEKLIRRIKYANVVDNKSLTPKVVNANVTERVLELFRPTSIQRLLYCLAKVSKHNQHLENYSTVLFYLHFKISCQYVDKWNHPKAAIADFLATYQVNNEVINVNRIDVKVPYAVGETMRNIPIEYQAKVEFAQTIYKFVLGQMSEDYKNSKENADSLMSYMKNETFSYTMCGHKNHSLAGFKEHLDRSRRKIKMIERTPIFDIVNYTPRLIIKLKFILTSFMNFMMKETYYITVEGGKNTGWKIVHFEVNGSCINYDNFDRDSIYPMKLRSDKEDGVTAEQFKDQVRNSLFNILNNEKINGIDYSPMFEALIESNPNVSESYSLADFKQYMRGFVVNNKFRENEGNPINTTMLLEEDDHFVVKFTMVFDYFIGKKNGSTKDEWIFVVEAFYYNDEKQWKIDKLIMKPPHNLLGNDAIQQRTANAHIASVDENFKAILQKVENVPNIDQKTIGDCESMTYNYTPPATVFLVHRLLSYMKQGKITHPIVTVRYKKNWKVDAFSFKIWYFYVLDNVRKHLPVEHHVIYNYKFDYYRETKMELSCPSNVKEGYD